MTTEMIAERGSVAAVAAGQLSENRPADNPVGLRERKKLATRQALGIAAMRLAVRHGVENVLVEDIAAVAEVSARTFNNYFSSKYEAICSLGLDRALRVGAALRERPAGEDLWPAIVNAVMSEYGAADQPLDPEWMAGIRVVTSTPALRGEHLKVQYMIQHSLAEAIAIRLGARAEGSMFPRILAASVTSTVQVVFERWVSSDPPVALGPLMRRGLNELADGMRRTLDTELRSDTG